tara:strand:- start:275 stop:502 length:228 start_codon:yes stop_codon:yes gene_type:complete
LKKESVNKLWKLIQKSGDYLQNKLPDSSNHPKGRNPYAHVALCVKENFGNSYKDIEDEKFKEVVDFIEHLKNNSS